MGAPNLALAAKGRLSMDKCRFLAEGPTPCNESATGCPRRGEADYRPNPDQAMDFKVDSDEDFGWEDTR